jgi:hypothetical protein
MNIFLYKTELMAKLLNHELQINLKVRQLITWSVQFFLFFFTRLCVAKAPIDDLFGRKIYFVLPCSLSTENSTELLYTVNINFHKTVLCHDSDTSWHVCQQRDDISYSFFFYESGKEFN